MSLVTSILVPPSGNVVEVHATNPSAVSEAIQARLGPGLPVSVSGGQAFMPFTTRYDQSGPVYAGAALQAANKHECTAGYSAKAPVDPAKPNGPFQYFVLTAGHCYETSGIEVGRQRSPVSLGYNKIGVSARNEMRTKPYVDIGTVTIAGGKRSHSVLNGTPLEPQSIQGSERPPETKKVCWSGVVTGHHCGYMEGLATMTEQPTGKSIFGYVVKGEAANGDSGGPVWDPTTHRAVGTIVGSSSDIAHCVKNVFGVVRCDHFAITPLRVSGSPVFGGEAKLGVQVLAEGN